MKIDEFITRLRKEHNIIITVQGNELKIMADKEVLTNNIIGEIKDKKSEILRFFKAVTSGGNPSTIRRLVEKAHYQLSSVQQRLYFLHQFDPKSIAYNVSQVFRLTGHLQVGKLEEVFKKLIVRHESLRTYFELIDGDPVQRIAGHTDFFIEYCKTTETESASVIDKFIKPFNLNKAPLLRVELIETGVDSYLLMVDMHHIITDGISVNLLIKDFMAVYNQEILPMLDVQYKEFAEWQQSEEQKQVRKKQRQFWLALFEDEVSIAELPTDFPRPLVNTFEGSSVNFCINAEDTGRLKLIAAEAYGTLFMILLAAFNVLLNKLSGQEDIVIGIPTTGRSHAQLGNIIGMFVNTLPLRNYPKGELTFREFLNAVRTNLLTCLDNQSYTYEDLIDDLQLERDISRNPLFDVMFAFQNFEKTLLEIPGLTLEPCPNNRVVSKFDITLTAVESADQVLLNLEYSTALFKRETIERFVTYFKKIISSVIENSGKKISDIDFLTNTERTHILYEFNNTLFKQNGENTVVKLFEEKTRTMPSNMALCLGNEALTYQEVSKLSETIAVYLQSEKGVKAGDLIGVILEREIYLVPCLFGIWKAGAAYVPIDPTYPPERIITVVKDARLSLLIARQEIISVLSQHSVESKILDLDKELEVIRGYKARLLPGTCNADSLAYVMYTSGSTGAPKGVMITHQSLFNYVTWAAKEYTDEEKTGFALYTSISFDLTITSIFVPLITGNTIFIYPEKEHCLLIEEVLSANKAAVVKLTPAHLRIICDSNTPENVGLSKVKRFIVGGEQLEYAVALRVYEKFKGNIEIYNEYGPTETTVGCMIHKFNSEQKLTSVPIGFPIQNTQVYLLDRFRQPVATGVKGELYISGDGVASGYYLQYELTKEKFLDNPFIKGRKMYKTGDLAVKLASGEVVFKGRIDDQVKIRGYRMELGEIEGQLKMHEKVKDAVVVVREKKGDRYLVGYYVSEDDISVIQFRNYLSVALPEYMIPSYFVRLMEIPLTVNGKLNRSILPEPKIKTDEYFVPPSGKTEELMVDIWADILGIEKNSISIRKSFFELGGNSLKIVRLHSLINKQMDCEITIPQLFRYSTISSLCSFINMKDTTDAHDVNIIKDELSGMEQLMHGFS